MQAVKPAKEIGGAKAAKELGIPEGTIHTWMKAVRAGKLDIGEGSHTPAGAMSLSEEITMLRRRVKEQDKEIRRLKEESDIFEKNVSTNIDNIRTRADSITDNRAGLNGGRKKFNENLIEKWLWYSFRSTNRGLKGGIKLKILKKIILGLLLLTVMSVGGTIVLKIFDLILKLNYENIWISGFKVGFVAWIGMLINKYYHYLQNRKPGK